MPGPGKRHQKSKSKPKPSSSSANVSETSEKRTFVHDIDTAEGWNVVVAVLCDAFNLPDMNRRSGLKKIHANFPEIYKKLENAYNQNIGNEKIMGGIVGIWAKMCVDSILRDKLMKAGMLAKLLPLLDIRDARVVGLQALATVTHHGGMAIRVQIAKETTARLLRLMEEIPNDMKCMELIITTLTHSVGAVACEEEADMKLIRSLDIPHVLRVVFENVKKPEALFFLLSHGLYLLTSLPYHCYREVRAIPPLVSLMVGCLRSADLSLRCQALMGIIRLNAKDSEEDFRHHDPQKFIASIQRGFPADLSDLMMNWGPANCEITLTLQTSVDYQKAMMGCAQDQNLYKLGKTLAGLIQRTEYSIAEGGFQAYNERTGQAELMDIGLPFKMWTDALPHCAKALRATGSKADLDDADILMLKFHIIRQHIPDAIDLAKKAIDRNPNVAYFYYVIGLGADTRQALTYVKKGLKVKKMTPFVRNYLLWRAVASAGDLGVTLVSNYREGESEHTDGVAHLMSAWEDAKTFVAEAPPDSRHLITVLNWYIVLTMAIRGPELSIDLKELDDAFKKVEVARRFSEFLNTPFKKTQMRLSRELCVRLYQPAAMDWVDFVKRHDVLQSQMDPDESSPAPSVPPTAPPERVDDLASWFETMNMDEESGHSHGYGHGHGDDHVHGPQCYGRSRMKASAVELYRCSWCRNPSAVLKKCSGCGKTRYCDGKCQKSHWSEHRDACKAAQSGLKTENKTEAAKPAPKPSLEIDVLD
ncbi:hypothetical protein C8Q75DRAFT_852150 [Abortiporus biennis]|nr:hypothetical protein C8Q75DRAFT_852150 [Abortiporus biennis]